MDAPGRSDSFSLHPLLAEGPAGISLFLLVLLGE